ncbi:DUF6931 family protein [Cohaesibacter marisflavi]|uniref:DUF6931 family protein n=1 Tax=Cohaesibacter marisflavi TaxID=655353 RepID=UPI0029C69AB3|nr:hypothetical protein [Cohaesibacter marisflavi]
MTISTRFSDLKKLPEIPAAKALATGNVVLQTSLEAHASASIPEVLTELEAKGALVDMLQLLAHALPAREATWWSCLAARETLASGALVPASVQAAEAWVRQPGVATRTQARAALDRAGNEDNTAFCAMAASFADGTLGPGNLNDYDTPPGAVGFAVFGMVLDALFHDEDQVETNGPLLLERALNIARGGNGNVAEPAPIPSEKETRS